MNIGSDDPVNFITIADKLRYYRHRNGLLQREVADYVGIERTTYSAYEEDGRDYYPYDTLQRIAEFLKVKATDLVDDYNTFLRDGQAHQVKALRNKMKMTQAEFAAHFDITKEQIKKWEQGKARMTKKFWERIFLR
ncbi:MAG: helix-turn-helix domain-containing protein [Defluviitaleaceae bacterium]|nr:helix-turn-helix domain-containing protein [Defluviitaleaceae bacterium]